MEKGVNAVLITGDGLRHKYVTKCLSNDLNLIGVVCEAKKPFVADPLTSEGCMIADHFAARQRTEEKFFSQGSVEFDQYDSLMIPNGSVNEDYVFDWITAKSPNYLILYGSGIVGERLLDFFENRCINMHLGLSPYYRGAGTNLWPFVNGEPECVGVTIHLAVLDVDAGAILRQARPVPEVDDTVHDLGCKTIQAGAAILGRTVIDFHDNKITGVKKDLSVGQVYLRSDFNHDALVAIKEKLKEGMMRDYVNNMVARQSRYPIVE